MEPVKPVATVPSLARELERVAAHFRDGPVRVAELEAVFDGQASYRFLAVLSLPFLTPIPLLGLATPAGLVVMAVGFQIALGRSPQLPTSLAAKELPPRFLPTLLQGASRVLRWVELVIRPRWGWICDRLGRPAVTGVLLALAGFLLLLPIPVPFSNALPASAILLLAVAGMIRDGLAFLAGAVALLFSAAFLAAVAFGGWELLDWLTR